MTVDWVHLVAMTAWIGGLVVLTAGLVVLRRRSGSTDVQSRVVRRFSRLAVTSVVLLSVTGLYGATQHFSALGSLFTTAYGRVLLVKIALFGILLLFGAANKLVLMPRLAVPGEGERAFTYTVPSEMAVATVRLFVVGVLTSIAPG
jgi:putative copper export protein